MSEHRAAALDEVPVGAPKLVEVGGTRVVLMRVGDAVHALGDVCSHQGGPLSEGTLAGGRLTCPWHGWTFDVRTGHCALPSRGGAVPSYPVRIDAGQIWVELP